MLNTKIRLGTAAALAVGLATSAACQVTQDIATSGQSEVTTEIPPAVDTAGEKTGDASTPSKKKRNITVSATFAPSLTGNLPLEDGDRLTDLQSSTLAIKWTMPLDAKLNPGWSWTLEAGAKREIELYDDDDGEDVDNGIDDDPRDPAKSALFASTKVNWDRGLRRLSPFAGFTLERGYTGPSNERSYTDKRLSAGLKIPLFRQIYCKPGENPRLVRCTGKEALSLTLSGSIERTFSSVETRERITPQLKADLAVKLVSGIDWNVTATGERRIFETIDGIRRKDWRLLSFAGLDFTKLVAKRIRVNSTGSENGEAERKRKMVFSELKFGVRWSLTESNVDIRDDSDFDLLPIVTLSTSF